jgi:uncharacterized delta-60 repeat protein
MKKISILLGISLIAISASAQLNQLWTQQYNNTSGYGQDFDEIMKLVSDNSGYIYATGYSNNNVATMKFNAATGNIVWEKTFNGAWNGADAGNSCVLDGLGNIYVVGYEGVSTGSAAEDFLILKYDTAGNFIWKRNVVGTYPQGWDEGKAITCDAAGNVYATGKLSNNTTVYDMCTVKLDPAGNFVWTQILDGPGGMNDAGYDIDLDPSGNVYVAGELSFPSSSYEFSAVVKYNNSGTYQWTSPLAGGSGYDYYNDILVTNTGAVYAVGSYYSASQGENGKISRFNTSTGATIWSSIYNSTGSATDEFKKLTRDPVTGALYVTGDGKNIVTGNGEMLTAKYDSLGVYQWAKFYTGFAAATDYGFDITRDGSGNVWTCGYVENGSSSHDLAVVEYNPAGTQLYADYYGNAFNNWDEAAAIVYYNNSIYVGGYQTTATTAQDYLFIKYSTAGSRTWLNTWAPPISPYDASNAVVTDAAGNIYIAGRTEVGTYHNDFLVLKYNSAGVFQWQYTYTGNSPSQEDNTTGIAVDGAGNVYVCGYVYNTATMKDGVVIKLNAAGTQQWVNVYNNTPNKDDVFNAIRVDASGNAFVTGYRTNSSNQTDVYTSEYNTAGVFQWGTSFTGTAAGSADIGNDLELDGSGNVIVVGKATYTSTLDDMVRIKYNSTGVQQWGINYTASANYDDVAKCVKKAPNGDFYCAGYRNIGGLNKDIFLMRFNSSGTIINTATITDNNGDEEPYALTIMPTNKILLSGTTSASPSGTNMGTFAYSPTLVQQWSRSISGNSSPYNQDMSNSVAYNSITNKIYSTGTLENGAFNYKDMQLAVYDTLGNLLNSVVVDNPENTSDFATGAIPDTSGNVTLVGWFNWQSHSDILLTKYCTPASVGSMSSGPVNVCAGSTGNIYTVNAVNGATSYNWTYGGAGATITGNGNSVSIDFSSSATSDTLYISAVNGCGAGNPLKYFVNVRPRPNFGLQYLYPYGNDTVCFHTVTSFHPTGTGYTSLLWMPGGYTNLGNRGYYIDSNFVVTVIATSAYGCTDTASMNNVALPRPTAGFTSSSTTILPGGTVNYTDASIGSPNTWNWTFTGGTPTTSTSANPSGIIYSTAGSYPTKQVVMNSYGCKDSITIPYYVNVSGPLPALNEIYSASGLDLVMTDGAEAENKTQLLLYNDATNGYVTKIRGDGSVIWTKKFNNTYLIKVAVADSNNYYIGSINQPSPGISFTVITKLDKSGNVHWEKKYDNTTSSIYALSDLVPTKTKGCLALMEYTIGSPYNGYVVMKVDSGGNTLWRQYDYNSNAMNVYRLIETMNGDVVVVNTVYSSVSTTDAMQLVRYTSAGVYLWQKEIGTASFPLFDVSVAESQDSSLVLVSDDALPAFGPNLNMVVTRTDKSGNVLWMKGLNGLSLSAGYFYGGNVALNANGDISFLTSFQNTDVSGTVWHETSFAMFGFDANMDTLKWNNWIQGSSSFNVPYFDNLISPVLKPMKDGDFAVYTTNHDHATWRYSPMMMRAYIDGDFSGCYEDTLVPHVYNLFSNTPSVIGLTSGAFTDVESPYTNTFGTQAITHVSCAAIVITGDVTTSNENQLMKLFPNPTNGEVNITLPEKTGTINIYNSMGSLVYTMKAESKELKVDFSGYDSGIYLLEWTDGNGSREVSKVVKQ